MDSSVVQRLMQQATAEKEEKDGNNPGAGQASMFSSAELNTAMPMSKSPYTGTGADTLQFGQTQGTPKQNTDNDDEEYADDEEDSEDEDEPEADAEKTVTTPNELKFSSAAGAVPSATSARNLPGFNSQSQSQKMGSGQGQLNNNNKPTATAPTGAGQKPGFGQPKPAPTQQYNYSAQANVGSVQPTGIGNGTAHNRPNNNSEKKGFGGVAKMLGNFIGNRQNAANANNNKQPYVKPITPTNGSLIRPYMVPKSHDQRIAAATGVLFGVILFILGCACFADTVFAAAGWKVTDVISFLGYILTMGIYVGITYLQITYLPKNHEVFKMPLSTFVMLFALLVVDVLSSFSANYRFWDNRVIAGIPINTGAGEWVGNAWALIWAFGISLGVEPLLRTFWRDFESGMSIFRRFGKTR
jgi:hypothetical protein